MIETNETFVCGIPVGKDAEGRDIACGQTCRAKVVKGNDQKLITCHITHDAPHCEGYKNVEYPSHWFKDDIKRDS